MKVDVINCKPRWHAALQQLGAYDFAHTFDFHQVSQRNGEGEPLMFLATDDVGEPVGCWPVLRREVGSGGDCDFTSVYGYAGPVFRAEANSEAVLQTISQSMKEYGAISLFSRMHPLFIQQISDESLRGSKISDVVIVNLLETADVTQEYRGGHRRDIANARNRGVSISIDHECDCLGQFVNIYRQAMVGLSAADYYHFNDDYFQGILKSSDFKPLIIFAELDGCRIAASMFVMVEKIMHYFLSGTVFEHRKLAGSKVILSAAHELAIKLGCDKLILGGGVGGAQDSLFKFKTGFSSFTRPFYVARRVIDDVAYARLCLERGVSSSDSIFFPAYRKPNA